MEPNKFEKDLKTKLDNREIQPSEQAWDKLEAMLTMQERPKKKFPWFLIAASLIGIVFLMTILFKSNVLSTNEIEIQNKNSVVTNDTILSTEKKSVINKDTQILNLQENAVAVANENPTSNQQLNSKKKRVSIINNNQNQEVAVINKPINEKSLENNIDESTKQKVSNEPIEIAAIPTFDENKNNIELQKSTLKVDASALLSQVDDELRQERQLTIFQKIGNNLQTVRTLVAERNIKK